jgi:hypothetical protein
MESHPKLHEKDYTWFEEYLRSSWKRQFGRLFSGLEDVASISEMVATDSGCPEASKEIAFLQLLYCDGNSEKLHRLLVEHPSKPDRKGLVSRLEGELVESQKIKIACGNEQDRSEASRDIKRIETRLAAAKNVRDDRSCRILGFVWASSGLTTKINPHMGAYHLAEDWALVRLIEKFRFQVQNTLDRNILRPDFTELGDQPFKGVRRWGQDMGWSRLRVFKRGRTTGYTIGYVNGTKTMTKLKVGQKDGQGQYRETLEFNIVSTSTNGLFSQPGDSGAWIMDKTGQLVGMMWGKLSDNTTAFTPADYLFKWIQRHFQEKLGSTTETEFTVRIYHPDSGVRVGDVIGSGGGA